ncbi:hypothetical protein LXM60_02090 [Pandoraea sputorum]|uniref:hypothetical protein n=1 Tax=Pandoraea sputorum TaxID=93222 RepID=UPI001E291398|nr:hypothetical protein [Pandoraea sputorum]MCE4059002.1 hypothetical protein [Pandoraea sputorum]
MTSSPRAGTLDPTFGAEGHLRLSNATALLPLPDGRFLTAGRLSGAVGATLFRYLSDGTPDPSFGEQGQVEVPFSHVPGHITEGNFLPTRLRRQSTGKIIVAGNLEFESDESVTMLARITPDGSLDTAFGNAGFTLVNLSPGIEDSVRGLEVHSDDRILMLARTETPFVSMHDMLCRLMADGTFDFSFGNGGIAPAYPTDNSLPELALRSDGKLYTAGDGVTRYDERGRPDDTFGGDGHIAFDFAGEGDIPQATGIALMSDGRIVLTGNGNGSPAFAWMWRLHAPGAPDMSFNNGEPFRSQIGPTDHATTALAVAPDGKIVCIGMTYGDSKLTLERLNADGSRDIAFGNDGVVIMEPPPGTILMPTAIHVLPDGKLLTHSRLLGASQNMLSRFIG